MVRKLIIACVFALGLFALLEFSYRLIIIGPAALNPFAINSYTNLLDSGNIKPSEYPSVYFELKPNLDVMLRGVPLRTNSQGLADKEYSVEKPENTYRIAVLGSSWTMPASVPPETAYHAVLEEALNARSTGVNYEVINFGVELYGLGEMVGTLEHRVKPYKPDLVIFAMTSFTSTIKWLDHKAPFQPEVYYAPFFQSMVLMQLGIGSPKPTSILTRPTLNGLNGEDYEGRFMAQIPAALYQANKLTTENGGEMVFLFLAFQPWFPKTESLITNTLNILDVPLVDAATALADGVTFYKVSELDMHPNPAAHQVIADELMRHLDTRLELNPN